MTPPNEGGPPVASRGELDASVVLPAHNNAATLPAQLEALAQQDYRGRWEVVVVDDDSRDASPSVVESWRTRLPSLRLIRLSKAIGVPGARNRGAADANGTFLLFCDADDIVAPNWISALVGAADDADAVGGSLDVQALNAAEARYWRSVDGSFPARGESLFPVAVGSNLLVRRDAFERVGGFDELMTSGGEDADLSFRLQLAGHRVKFADDAVVFYRLRTTPRSAALQAFRYARCRPYLYRKYAELGMERRSTSLVLKSWAWLLVHLWRLGRRRERGRWMWVAATNLGRLAGSVRNRVVYL